MHLSQPDLSPRENGELVVLESPRVLKGQDSKSSIRGSQQYLKLMTGTDEVEHEKAHRTFLNELGPGQYSLPPLTGRHSIESKRRNHPYISFGSKTKAPWHAEFHTDFVGQTSPPSTRYSPMMNK